MLKEVLSTDKKERRQRNVWLQLKSWSSCSGGSSSGGVPDSGLWGRRHGPAPGFVDMPALSTAKDNQVGSIAACFQDVLQGTLRKVLLRHSWPFWNSAPVSINADKNHIISVIPCWHMDPR